MATLALVLAGCGSNSETGTTATSASAPAPAPVDRKALRAVPLPDLSKLDAVVQQQLRDGDAALTAKTGNPAISDADLGLAYGEMGKLLMAAEYRDAAEPAFLNAEALTPNDRRWPYYLAQLYKLKGDARQATASFERALRAKPDDLPTLVWLGSAYLDQGRAADAEPLFSTAFSIAPRSVPVLFGLGRTALAKQEYARAVDYLEQALTLDPKAAVIHFPLAMAYRAMGDVRRRRRRTCGCEVPARFDRPIR